MEINQKFVHADVEAARDVNELISQSELFEMARRHTLQCGLLPNGGATCLNGDGEVQGRGAFLGQLAADCLDLGVEMDYAVALVRLRYPEMADEGELAVRNLYDEKSGRFGRCAMLNKEQRREILFEEFFKANYRLRYNVMTRQTEYADLNKLQTNYLPLTNRVRYDMISRAWRFGITTWDIDIRQRTEAASVRDFCPVEDFLRRLPKWDGKRRIERLAETVPTLDKDWPQRFRVWFLSMTAHWLTHDPKWANALIPVLVGPQGCGKSQWIRSLLPEEMQPYYHDGFDLRNRQEAERMMVRYGLINIDEFDAMTPRQEPVLKHLVQLSEVHIDGQPSRRYCSFIATSNHYGLHRDTSGSRRYIFIDITGDIRLNHRIPILQCYAEAVAAIEADERTWLTKAEELRMQRQNEDFREQDIAEQLFHTYYDAVPTRQEVPGAQWLMAAEIFQNLERWSKKDLGIKRATRFGAILRKHCGAEGSKKGRTSRLYHVRYKGDDKN